MSKKDEWHGRVVSLTRRPRRFSPVPKQLGVFCLAGRLRPVHVTTGTLFVELVIADSVFLLLDCAPARTAMCTLAGLSNLLPRSVPRVKELLNLDFLSFVSYRNSVGESRRLTILKAYVSKVP